MPKATITIELTDEQGSVVLDALDWRFKAIGNDPAYDSVQNRVLADDLVRIGSIVTGALEDAYFSSPSVGPGGPR